MLIRESAITEIRELVPTTARTATTTETTRKTTATDHDLDPLTRLHVLEAEARQMTTFTSKPAEELAGIPTRVLEAELRRRREAEAEEVSEADLDKMSARTFGRSTGDEAKTETTEISETDLDQASAQAFGREIKEDQK